MTRHADPPDTSRASPTPGSDPAAAETVRLDRIVRDGDTLRIPIATVRESTGYFILYAGRHPRPGEQLMRDGDLRYAP